LNRENTGQGSPSGADLYSAKQWRPLATAVQCAGSSRCRLSMSMCCGRNRRPHRRRQTIRWVSCGRFDSWIRARVAPHSTAATIDVPTRPKERRREAQCRRRESTACVEKCSSVWKQGQGAHGPARAKTHHWPSQTTASCSTRSAHDVDVKRVERGRRGEIDDERVKRTTAMAVRVVNRRPRRPEKFGEMIFQRLHIVGVGHRSRNHRA
jgi:hypothetical protein